MNRDKPIAIDTSRVNRDVNRDMNRDMNRDVNMDDDMNMGSVVKRDPLMVSMDSVRT
jgi:hypothetical protein